MPVSIASEASFDLQALLASRPHLWARIACEASKGPKGPQHVWFVETAGTCLILTACKVWARRALTLRSVRTARKSSKKRIYLYEREQDLYPREIHLM